MSIAALIDHTLLKAEATPSDVSKLCQEAREQQFYSVCLNPQYIAMARNFLQNSGVKTITVVGFPLGANLTDTKVEETKQAIAAGAEEIDMVANIGAMKSAQWDLVQNDIAQVVKAAGKTPVKVIIESAALTRDEITQACKRAQTAGAAFVKTSTGFHPQGGATAEAVQLMRETVGPDMGVKASGGIRNLDDAKKMIAAGANRLGTSASVMICQGLTTKGAY